MFATDLRSQGHHRLATGEPSIEIVGLLGDAGLPADLLDAEPVIRLLQDEGDLLFAEPRCPHQSSSRCLPGSLRDFSQIRRSSFPEAGHTCLRSESPSQAGGLNRRLQFFYVATLIVRCKGAGDRHDRQTAEEGR